MPVDCAWILVSASRIEMKPSRTRFAKSRGLASNPRLKLQEDAEDAKEAVHRKNCAGELVARELAVGNLGRNPFI